ncbi:unnamed protein product [Ostreobium quekettii]|uniref:Serine/threonine-protein phosphatase n=1 Tax=Ostreobium quekettii TaxID=121088 RepID=A0A8S1JGJ3_9CHLO|nr:unnamed protein product [Ostreobium quekettii]
MDHDRVSAPPPRPRSFPLIGAKPGPRCGHTLTTIYPFDGDPATAKLVMFGGATALEGTSRVEGGAGPGTPAQASGGQTGIRLAGATNEVHVFDVRSGTWEKVHPQGEAPSPRAAHAGAAVGSMVVIQGGIGPAGLASEDLHVIDFTDFNRPKWHRVMVQGAGPGARYAHVLALVANRFLVVMGGNDGKSTLGDAWALDTSEKPYKWRKISDSGDMPSARMYASSAARQDGLLLLCGGRDVSGTPLGDAYGFARHRDGRWEWAAAPGLMPVARYQHAAVFVGARLHITGGAVGGGRMVEEASTVVSLDTSAGVWCRHSTAGRQGDDSMRRCRHSMAAVGNYIFIYGGLRGSQLLEDLLVASDGIPPGELTIGDPNSPGWNDWLVAARSTGPESLAAAAAEEAAAVQAIGVAHQPASPTATSDTDLHCAEEVGSIVGDSTLPRSPTAASSTGGPPPISTASSPISLKAPGSDKQPPTPEAVRLWHRAVVVPQEHPPGNLRGLVRQLSLDQFENEGRRVSMGMHPEHGPPAGGLVKTSVSPLQHVHKRVIDMLLNPRQWSPPMDRRFFLSAEEISELCEEAENIFKKEPTVLSLQAPIKLFGDLHGQFGDLMRLFEEYGMPSVGGDITYIDYLFLGDYVDRGAHSLETICLLLALKIKFPDNVHLIRGNHEAADINALFGFRLECLERLGDPDGIWAWQRINAVFNWLPLAALIQDKVLCMHGGIGRSIERTEQISCLQRPLTMEEGGVVLMDLLWSDPTMNDSVEGVQPSPRGPGLVTFGPDRVMDFCNTNNLQMIVRAHECVMDGFERFAQGHLITLFSATNYCGTANNAGAILVLGRNLVLVPKLIHPLPPTTPRSSDSAGVEENAQQPTDTWMQVINEERPPTPPRGRPNANPNLEYI